MSNVSIVMTVYNAERYIVEAIRSILDQTMSDFEFIIVNDGSTDRTKEIIATFDDPRIQFYSLDHIGRARALNYAVGKAQSPYIAFMDADDISVQERIEKQYHYLQQNPEIGLVSGWFALIDSSGMEMNILRKLPAVHEEIEYEMTSHCSMCFPAAMMRRTLIIRVDGFNEQLNSAIDYDLFIRILPLSKISNLQELLFYHRIHHSRITSRQHSEQLANTFNIAKSYLERLIMQSTSQYEKNKLFIRFGINEYYRGSMTNARHYFLSALPECWKEWLLWRYLLPSFIGDKIIMRYRKNTNVMYTDTNYHE